MKIILSPSKTQKTEVLKGFELKPPFYASKTNLLIEKIQGLTVKEIKKIMKTSDKLTEKIYEDYQNIHKNKCGHALASYTGVAYKALDINSFSKKDISYAEENLRILSALYGILSPLTGIMPYRLDMTIPLLKKQSLYNLWQEDINSFFKDELVINLASGEFSRMLKREMLNIEFYEKKENKLVQISTNAKKPNKALTKNIKPGGKKAR